jgi:molecular chaperone GrpE
MTYAQLIEALRKEGVEVIDALGQPFDHNLHHALLLEAREGVEKISSSKFYKKDTN